MPGMADGSIVVDTEIDASGFARDSAKLQTAVNSLGKQVDRLGPTLRKAMSGSASAMSGFTDKSDQAEATIAELESRLDALGSKRVKTQAYKDLEKETESAGKKLESLLNQQERMDELGQSKNSQAYKRLVYDLEQASIKYNQLTAAKQRMENSGQAYILGSETAQYQQLSAQLDEIRAKYADMRAQAESASSAWSSATGVLSSLGGILRSALSGVLGILGRIASAIGGLIGRVASLAKAFAGKLLSAVKSVGASITKLFTKNKLTDSVGGLTKSLKKLIPALLATRGVMGILRKAVNAFLQANTSVAGQLQNVWSGLGNILGPIIQKLVNLVSTVMSYVIAFLRLLGITASASTDAMQGAGGAAKDLKQQLSGLDEIHTWQSDKGGGGGGGASGGAALPEVQLSDWSKQFAEQLKEAWTTNAGWGTAGNMLAEKLNEMVASVNWDDLGVRLGKKLAGALKFLAQAIRDFDFVGLFTGLFNAARRAIAELDPTDIGTLLATKFILIFSALKGAIDSGIIPEIGTKISQSITAFFATIRQKFAAGPGENGWESIGKTASDAIKQVLLAIQNILTDETMWGEIVADVQAFLNGFDFEGIWETLKTVLTTAGEKIPWEDILNGLKRFISRIMLFIERDMLHIDDGTGPMETLRGKLEDGSSIDWIDILSGLSDFIGEIIDKIKGFIPAEGWDAFWNDIKDKLAGALTGGGDWEDLKTQVGDKIGGILTQALDMATHALYQAMMGTGNSAVQWIAEAIFPEYAELDSYANEFNNQLNQYGAGAAISYVEGLEANGDISHDAALGIVFDAIDGAEEASTIFQQKLDTEGRAAANAYLQALVNSGDISNEVKDWIVENTTEGVASATEICIDVLKNDGAEAANAWIQAMVDSGNLAYDEACAVVENVQKGFVDASTTYQSILDSQGRKAANSYVNALVSEGQLRAEDAGWIVKNAADGIGTYTETYLLNIRGCGQSAADQYLEGLVSQKLITAEQAAAIAQGAVDALAGMDEQFDDAGLAQATKYITGILSQVGESEAAGNALGNATAGAAAGVETSSAEIESAAADAAATVPPAIAAEQENARTAAEGLGGAAKEGVQEGIQGYADTIDTEMGAGAESGGQHANVMRQRVTTHVRNMKRDSSKEIGEMQKDASSAFEAMSGTATDEAGRMEREVSGAWKSVQNTVKSVCTQLKNTVQQSFTAMQSSVTSQSKASQQNSTNAWKNIRDTVKSCAAAIKSAATTDFQAARQAVETAVNGMKQSVQQGMQAMQSTVSSTGSNMRKSMTDALSSMRTSVNNEFTTMKNRAYSWGADICSELARGIRGKISTVTAAAQSAASSIRSYLHFSVPDKGPLADADTYMPDFMDLLADGMRQNGPVAARAAANVAEAISDEIQNGGYAIRQIDVENPMDLLADKMLTGFEAMLERMQAMADRITFTMPAVATAGIVPYSVGAVSAKQTAAGSDSSQMAELIGLLRQYVRPTQPAQSGETRVSVEVKGRTLLDVVLDEGRASRKASGRNPFVDI